MIFLFIIFSRLASNLIKPFSRLISSASRPSVEGKFIHGGNPILRWMAGNVVAEIDAAENIKPSKKKSTEKIDGIVAWIMALDRCIRHEMQGSVYDEPGHELVVI